MMRTKYPRTMHLPFSQGITSDDKVMYNTTHFDGKQVVVTVKMDGENATMYSDGFHARSLDSRHHPSRDWLARFHGSIAHNIPTGWRICGENLYARHSIAYDDLPTFFLGFSAWTEDNTCLSWDDTLELFEDVGVTPVEVLWRGEYDESDILDLVKRLDPNTTEGVVVRLADSYQYDMFSKSVAKWVRANHVVTDTHWMHQAIIPNKLLSS